MLSQASRDTTFEYPHAIHTFNKILWAINFGILYFLVILNQNFYKTRADLKIMFSILNSTHLNIKTNSPEKQTKKHCSY